MTAIPYIDRPAPFPPADCVLAVAEEESAVSIDFLEMRMIVRHRTTPANDFFGDPNDH